MILLVGERQAVQLCDSISMVMDTWKYVEMYWGEAAMISLVVVHAAVI